MSSYTPDQSKFDFRPAVLSRQECEQAAQAGELAQRLGALASSELNVGLARRLEEIANDNANLRQEIIHRATVSAVAQVHGNRDGRLDIRFNQTIRDGNPQVTVTQVSAHVINPPKHGERVSEEIDTGTGANFSAKAGLEGLWKNAEMHARATVVTPPAETKVEFEIGFIGLAQRAAALLGFRAGRVEQIFTPEDRELAVYNETNRLFTEASSRASSQISEEIIQQVVASEHFQDEYHGIQTQAAEAATVEWYETAAQVAQDFGDDGRFAGMSALEASIASAQITGHWSD